MILNHTPPSPIFSFDVGHSCSRKTSPPQNPEHEERKQVLKGENPFASIPGERNTPKSQVNARQSYGSMERFAQTSNFLFFT